MSYEPWSNPNVCKAKQGVDFIADNIDMPITNNNFVLIVEGVMHIPCKSIGPIVRENEFDTVQEGGVNDYVLMRRKPISKPFTFTVERYSLTYLGFYDPLQEGADLLLPLILLVTPSVGDIDMTRRAYVFTGCTVLSKEYGDLNAEQSGLLTEKTTITYRELMVVSKPPMLEALKNTLNEWSFSGTEDGKVKDFKGKGRGFRRERNAENYGSTSSYALKKDSSNPNDNGGYEVNQDKWDGYFPNDNRHMIKGGEAFASGTVGKAPSDKKNPKMWGFDGKKVEGNGKINAKEDENSTYALLPTIDRDTNGGYVGNDKKWTGKEPTKNRHLTTWGVTESTEILKQVKEKEAGIPKWDGATPNENRHMINGGDVYASNTVGIAPSKVKNPSMWGFKKKTKNGNGKTNAKPDTDSKYAIDPTGSETDANRGYAVNSKKWSGKTPSANRHLTTWGAAESSEILEQVNKKEPGVPKWNGKTPNANRHMIKGGNAYESNTVGTAPSKEKNPEMWGFDQKKAGGNGKTNARADEESKYALAPSGSETDANRGYEANGNKWSGKTPSANRHLTTWGVAESSEILEQVNKKEPGVPKWDGETPNANRHMIKGGDAYVSNTVGTAPSKEKNPEMWGFDQKKIIGNGKIKAKADNDSKYALSPSGSDTDTNRGYAENSKKWSGKTPSENRHLTTWGQAQATELLEKNNKKEPGVPKWDGKTPNANRHMINGGNAYESNTVGTAPSKEKNPEMWGFSGRNVSGNGKTNAKPDTESTYALNRDGSGNGGFEENPDLWNIKNPTKNRHMFGEDEVPSQTIGAPRSREINPEMWRFDEKKENGNGKQSARKDVSVDVPEAGRRLWKFDKEKKNFKGTGTRSARESFDNQK